MKAFIELLICKERNLKNPTTEMVGGYMVNTWKYNSVSFACQGVAKTVTFKYKESEYDFNIAVKELINFIKKNS